MEIGYREILALLFWPFVKLWESLKGCLKGCICGLVDDCIEPCLGKCGVGFVRLGWWMAKCAGFVGDYLGVYKPQDNAWPMFGAGATLAAASLKDEDKLVYPMLAAAYFVVGAVLLWYG